METNNTEPEMLLLSAPGEPKSTVDQRQAKAKAALIEALKLMPIVEVACKRVSVGRTNYYRFRKSDPEFAKQADEALGEGIMLMNDMAEAGLINSVKNQDFSGIAFWLKHRHPKYSPKLEVTGSLKTDLVLSPELEQLTKKALRFGGFGDSGPDKEKPS